MFTVDVIETFCPTNLHYRQSELAQCDGTKFGYLKGNKKQQIESDHCYAKFQMEYTVIFTLCFH